MSRRRGLRLAAIAALALLALVAVGVVAFPEIVRRVVVWRLAAMTGREVTLGGASVHLFDGRLALHDLRVIDRDRGPLATIERLDARFSPRDLLHGHLRVTDATLRAPTLRIVRTGPGEFNVSDLLARPSGGGAALAVTLEHFALRDGAVAIEDRTLTPARAWSVDGVTLDARGVSTLAEAPPGVVTVSAVAAGSPISVWVGGVQLAPLRFQATVIARQIDGSLAALYLPPSSPLSPARATLDASATIEQDAVSGTRITLDAVFSGVELRRAGRKGTVVSAPAVRVTVEDLRVRPAAVELGRLAIDGGTVTLEDARLAPVRRWQAEGVAFEARNLSSARDAPAGVGSLRAVVAGAPLSVWIANLRLAPLELSATANLRNVDFALFRLYVPPDLPVQPERGVLNASVRIEYSAQRGTRLGLDAALGNVELRRPAHFVTAPAVRITAEDIAFGAGAVTVGRAALLGDRLTLEDRTLRPPRTWPVRDLAIEASHLSSRRQDVQGVATVRATVAGAAVSAWLTRVRLDPLELSVTAILRNLDLALVQLYLPPEVPVQLGRGIVNASVQVDHDIGGGSRLTGDVTLTGVEARGRGDAAGLAVSARSLRVALADARRHGEALDVGRLELTATGSLLDSRAAVARFDFEDLRLTSESLTWPIRGPARVELGARFRDGGEVHADGTALLTAPPPLIAWTTDLAVRLKTVDLQPLTAYVPPASGLSGRVSANLTASVAYGASLTARVRGDAGGAGLALADGGRTLISLRQLDAAGLDVLWPTRLAVRRLRLERPRALVERDRQGAFPLLTRLAPPPAGPPPSAQEQAPETAAARRAVPAIAVDELVVERGRLAFVDVHEGAPVRFDVPRIDLTLRDARWPGSAPARLRLDAALAEGATVGVEGTVSAEPATVDLKLALANLGLAPLQPYFPFRAGVSGRLDANLAIAGHLSPTPELTARGDATLQRAALSDGQQPLITVDRLSATGIDAAWPGRVDLGKILVRRSWARIERDRQGRFLLRTLLGRAPDSAAATSKSAPPAARAATKFEFRLGEGVFEQGAATIIDAVTTPPARFEIDGARLAVQDLTWPARGPMKVQLTSPTPAGGRLDVGGTVDLESLRLELRATLDGVELAPAQPYLPIEGRVAGRVTGDLTMKLALDTIAAQVAGQARLERFRLSDGDRPLVTAGRLEAVGIDVDWPRRFVVQRLQLRRPRLLIERDARGEIALPRLVTPHWKATAPAGPEPAPGAAPSSPGRPTVEIGTFSLERAAGRFVDQTTTPPYAEELRRINLTVTGATTVPGHRARFTGGGALGGGGTFTLQGQATAGDPPSLELKVDVHDIALPRANPYLDRFTTWTATRGTLSASASYSVVGTKIDARHDVIVRGLEVVHSDASDEVERRLGLPLGFLVSLLKNARGEIRLSVPVSGDLATREFDFQDAVWGAVRALAIRLLALPFARVGSLFFSEDSKVQAVAFAPAVFQAGRARLDAAMTEHLERIAAFLRDAPSVRVRLEPIFVQADLDALERERAAGHALPDDALRDLGTRRLEVVRQALGARGVEAARLRGSVRRAPFVEAGGTGRVEFDLRP